MGILSHQMLCHSYVILQPRAYVCVSVRESAIGRMVANIPAGDFMVSVNKSRNAVSPEDSKEGDKS
jgi:hypothetical protein